MRMEGESKSCRAQARHADEACRAGLALVNCDQPHSDHPLSSLNCLAHWKFLRRTDAGEGFLISNATSLNTSALPCWAHILSCLRPPTPLLSATNRLV